MVLLLGGQAASDYMAKHAYVTIENVLYVLSFTKQNIVRGNIFIVILISENNDNILGSKYYCLNLYI